MKAIWLLMYAYSFSLFLPLCLNAQTNRGVSIIDENLPSRRITRALIIGISEYDNQPKLDFAYKGIDG